jgi:hypothetical protein
VVAGILYWDFHGSPVQSMDINKMLAGFQVSTEAEDEVAI